MNIQRYSRWIWSSICAFVILTFLPMVLFDIDSRLVKANHSAVVLFHNWEISYESAPTESSEWLPFDADARAALAGYEGPVWLKRPMPDLTWNDPYLFFSMMRQFEVFLDGEKIYSFNMDHRYSRLLPYIMLHPVHVSPDLSGKQLMIHALWSKDSMGHDLALVGEMEQFLYLNLISAMGFLLTSLIGLLSGIVGLCFYLVRRDRLYGWFALFSLSMGLSLVMSSRFPQWFVDMTEVYYWGQLLRPLAIWACAGFFANTLIINRMKIIRRALGGLGMFVAAIAVVSIVSPYLYSRYAGLLDTVTTVVGFVMITSFLIMASRKDTADLTGAVSGQEDMEKRWILRGYWTVTIGAIISQAAYMFPDFLSRLLIAHPYWYRVIEGLLPNVLLLFILCMTMVIVGRVRRVYRKSEQNAAELLDKNKELEQFHRNLESLVESRTSELEMANRTLAVTMREKAETIAEMSVLEERNRIAYEMHDMVGHTLTAAIVQLEVTRKIAVQEKELPLDKLDMLSDLVRKGLDDIRKTVRVMKSDEEPPLPLEEALRELIIFTEDTMEVTVDSHISLQPGMSLGRMTDNVLYHALQEGLTNGIRHGGSRRFRFQLYREDDMLYFRLTNDGEPFGSVQPGFGLSSMMKRVELIGGTVTFRDSDEGCHLEITIPLS